MKIAIGLLVFLVVAGGVGLLILRSRSFHRYVLAQVIDRAEQATGGKVEIGDFTFHWSSLRLDFYRITLHGTEAHSDKPLLWVEHAGLNVKILSLLKWKFELSSLVIDHPVVHLLVDAAGHSNLPHPSPAKKGNKPTNVFNLAVRHFVLDHGEIDCNDRKIPLEAELHQLRAGVDFNALMTEYDGDISYHNGTVQFGAFSPLQHNFEAHFSASPKGIRVFPLVLTAGPSRISIKANLTDYSDPSIEGSYTVVLSARELARVIKLSASPSGDMAASGTFNYRKAPGRSVLDSLSVQGRVTSPKLSVHFAAINAEAMAVKGRYRLSRGDLDARDFEARLFGGRVTANLTILHLTGHPQGSVTVSAHSLSLAAAHVAFQNKRLAGVAVQGLLDGDVKASWHDHLAGLSVSSDATISAPAAPLLAAGRAAAIPLTGAIHLTYDGSLLTLNNTVLRTQHAEVDLNGSVGRSSALAIEARSDDLHETDLLATDVRRSITTSPPGSVQPVGVSGSATFQGSMQGPIQDPRLTGQLSAANLNFRGATLKQIQAGVSLSSSEIILRQGDLETSQGRIQFNASVALRNWSYAPSNPITLQLSATGVPLTDLENVANVHVPAAGILSAHISMHGSQLKPVGQGTVEIIKASAWNQSIQSISAHFQGTGQAVESTVTVRTLAGNAKASVIYYPQNQGYDGQLNIEGIRLQQLAVVKQRNLQISGTVTASAHGHGTVKSPQLVANVEIPQLKVGQQSITGVAAQATIANRVATLTFASNVSGSAVHADGTVNLSDDYMADLTFSTGVIQIAPLLAAYLPGGGGDLKGQTELHGWLRGPLKDIKRVQAHVDVPTLRLGYQSVQLANTMPISADYRNGTVVVAPAELKGAGTDLRFQASAPLAGNAPVSVTATGTVDLHVLQLLYPQWDSSGQAQLNLHVSGSRMHPDVQGELRIINALLEPPNTPLGLEKMNAVIAFTAGRANIQSLTAEAGGGAISARGFVSFQHGVHFNLGLTAQNVRVRYPPGVREVLDGNLTMTGSQTSALISGQVLIDRLSFTQTFDLASFASQFGATSLPSPNAGFAQRVKLNVAVRSSQDLALNSTQLSLTGSADLRVRGTIADPVVLGRATLTGGQLFFNSRRYQIQSGVIQFVNPVATEPIVNIRVTTTVNQYNLSVNFVGPFDRLRTTYTSDPPLPPLDILNLLLTGQTAEAPGTGLGAQSLLAQGLAGQVSSRVQKLAGVSSLTIDPQMGGHGTNAGARIAVQEQVTRKLFFTVSVDVTTTQDDIVQVEYEISRRLSLQAVRDQNGGYSLEVKVHKTF
ncbi:MAG: translocation/assembly module TamB domain-containing protein [Terriglobia bacterium]